MKRTIGVFDFRLLWKRRLSASKQPNGQLENNCCGSYPYSEPALEEVIRSSVLIT